ncbi:hypothetical protein K0M31_008955 [Melipona bicolor]|uniref:Uncharacterized protein n=1 Tax=Melipona bicolor TaxID=60889 RepID=A0AA40FQN8_9HYME|nr:hypothetical protein K0M31_008955 [Melipona bicolor]
MYNRHRRGLVHGIGSLSKLLFGTLDENDLKLINENIDKLFSDQNKLTHLVENQTLMFKQILRDNHFLDLTGQLSNNSKELNRAINNEILDRNLLILEILITELASKINDFYYMLILGKRGIIDTTLINVKDFMENYYELIRRNFVTTNNEAKFQDIIDSSRLTTVTKNNTLIYQIIIPIFERNSWEIVHYIVIPYKIQDSFVAPILENEYALRDGNNYIPINYEYLVKFCRDSSIGKICKRTQPTIHFNDESYDPIDKCKTALFKIDKITFIPLQENKYLAIPRDFITIQTICETLKQIKISKPSIISARTDCILSYDNNVMKIGGAVAEKEIKMTNYSFKIPFDDYDIKTLSDFIPTVRQITPNFKKYENSFEMIENQLANLKSQKRILSTTEIIIDVLKYLGYMTLGIATTYLLYKLGIFHCLCKILPRKICIKLFCNEMKIQNNTQPNISYTHCIRPEIEILEVDSNSHGPSSHSLEDSPKTRQPKFIRFGTKLNLRRGV